MIVDTVWPIILPKNLAKLNPNWLLSHPGPTLQYRAIVYQEAESLQQQKINEKKCLNKIHF